MIRRSLSLAAVLFTACALGAHQKVVQIVNNSGERIEVDWINPSTGEAVPFGMSEQGVTQHLNSFPNHTFVIRSSTHNETLNYLTVSDQDEQVIVVSKNLTLQPVDKYSKSDSEASSIVEECKASANQELQMGLPVQVVSDNLLECMEQSTAIILEQKNEELSFQKDLRRKIAGLAENYTCTHAQETSEPKEWRTWTHHRTGVTRKVGILHNRPASQIHILHDFISPEECKAIEETAKKTLHRGTVADGKGGSKLSESRKAWQAGLKVNWEKEEEGDLIAAVSRRLFDYTNDATGYNLSVEGQEDIMSIQYFGNGLDDPTPDRYMPHCDGDCNNLPHKTGGRVATMVMYCDVPEVGGGTNFQNANVYVKPTLGAAAFFSYMNPTTRVHDEGFTTHSGCPVYEGTKRIAVQWMRIGVDLDNPWDSFDTNTVQLRSRSEEVDSDDYDDDSDDDSDDDDEQATCEG